MKLLTSLLLTVCILSMVACSNNHKVETTQTRTTNYDDGSETTEVSNTESVSEDDSKSCSGVLSCTVDFMGDVLAFPFRLMAGIVETVF